jgi:phage terminase small subunit
MKPKGLNLRQRRFVDAFLGSANGNATRAAIAAGYSPKTAQPASARLLSHVMVQQALKWRQARETKRSILTADERDEHLSKLALSPAVPPATQVSAIKELNKCSGRHSIRHVLDVTDKLSDIVAGSRA